MVKYLLDTNILILSLHNQTRENLWASSVPITSIFVSTATLAEALVGASAKEEEGINEFIRKTNLLPIDESIARLAAKLRQQSLKTHKAFLQDCYIGATALLSDCTLVTNNKADFHFPSLRIFTP